MPWGSIVTVSYWLDRSKEKKLTCDVLIIGGGIAGLSAAFWLEKEDPSLKIALVEKGHLGSGATGRNAGFITCGSVEHFNRMVHTFGAEKAKALWKFSEKNLALLKEHIIQNHDIDFEQKGSFSLASTHEELKELEESAKLMASSYINVESLNEKQVVKRLSVQNFVGGVKYLDDASVHPIKLIHRLKESLNNVKIFEHQEVHSISKKGDLNVTKTDRQEIESSILIYATNAYSPLLEPYFKEKIYPTRGQILMTEPVDDIFLEAPCYANFVLDYFRQTPTREVLIGGFRQIEKDTEIGYSDQISSPIQNALENFLKDHIPQIAQKRITHRWSGVMGFSSDGQPLVGALPHQPTSYFLCGFTAHGLGLAFHTAKQLVALMFGRKIDSFISAQRFKH